MGSGVGGSPKDGLRLLDEVRSLNKAEVTLIDHQEMAGDEWAVMVAEVGAAKGFSEAESFPETVIALTLMQDVAAQSGKSIRYLMAGELWGSNTMLPLYVAALKGYRLWMQMEMAGQFLSWQQACILQAVSPTLP